MKLYLKTNVYDAALARVRRLFDEFPRVAVSFSGGKDSTVCLHLALKVAEERGRLPLPVMFIDQESEWRHVIDYIREVMSDPRVTPYWFQIPFRLSNSTTTGADPWLHCWQEGAEWIRPKEPTSIHANPTKVDRFKALFGALGAHYFGDGPLAVIGGVRCQESPARAQGLTSYATYKDITWGQVQSKKLGHYVFYPIYDWEIKDVWKAIHDHGWPYCKLYDFMYQHGIPLREMRVSSVHHETAVRSLRFLQEIEPDTWNRIAARVSGVNAVNQCWDAYHVPEALPAAFASWREYRDYLLENLIEVGEVRERFRRQFASWDALYTVEVPEVERKVMQLGIAAILVNDYECVKYDVFRASAPTSWKRNYGAKADRFTSRRVEEVG